MDRGELDLVRLNYQSCFHTRRTEASLRSNQILEAILGELMYISDLLNKIGGELNGNTEKVNETRKED